MKAHLRMLDRDKSGAMRWGRRSIAMAQRVGDARTFAAANCVVGSALLVSDDPRGQAYLDRCMEIASKEGFEDLVALANANMGSSYGEQYHFEDAELVLRQGIDHAVEHDLDYLRYYSLAWLALVRLYRGDWADAERLAVETLRQGKVSAISRIMALVALGRIRARRGARVRLLVPLGGRAALGGQAASAVLPSSRRAVSSSWYRTVGGWALISRNGLL
jgi:hypothetical protein